MGMVASRVPLKRRPQFDSPRRADDKIETEDAVNPSKFLAELKQCKTFIGEPNPYVG
jgi:hypothetical protein